MRSNDYYNRKYSLKFYDKNNTLVTEIFNDERNSFRGTRLVFKIRQQAYLKNQIAQFDLYNLNNSTQNLIGKSAYLILECGYQTDSGILYRGNLINIIPNKRIQPDYICSLFCLDYMDFYKPIWITLKKGISVLSAIQKIAQKIPKLQVNQRNIHTENKTLLKDILINNLEYTRAFQKLGNLTNVNIWATNEQVFAIDNNFQGNVQNKTIINIDYDHGMIGSPFYDVVNNGVNVTALINHRLIPGNFLKIRTLSPQISLESATYVGFDQNALTRGEWYILTAEHNGDSRGQEWYSSLQSYSFQPLGTNAL